MVGSPVPVTTWTSTGLDSTYTTGYSATWTGTAPACNVTKTDCKALWDGYYNDKNWTLPLPSYIDGCEDQDEWHKCGNCRLFAPEVELIYFPKRQNNRTINICSASNETVCPFGSTTAPFTSANAYDAANCAYGTDTTHATVTDGIETLSFRLSAISSL